MAPHATSPPPLEHSQPSQPIKVVASSRAVVAGRITEATIVISQNTGKITSIFHSVLPQADFPEGTPYTDYSPHILLPAFGGVTTVVDMPLNAIPPTTTVENLNIKVDASKGKCWVDVGFYGGIIPGNDKDLKGLVDAGVRGFKGFLCDSGVCVPS